MTSNVGGALALLHQPGTRVFVATGFSQRPAGAALMRALEARGLVITCDWTAGNGNLTMAETAARDVQGVKSAQVLVAVMTLPQYEYKGTFTEVGMAIGAGIPAVLVSPFRTGGDATCAKNVYFHWPGLTRMASTDELLAALDAGAAPMQ